MLVVPIDVDKKIDEIISDVEDVAELKVEIEELEDGITKIKKLAHVILRLCEELDE